MALAIDETLAVLRERGIEPIEEFEADLPGIGQVQEGETIYSTSIENVFEGSDDESPGSVPALDKATKKKFCFFAPRLTPSCALSYGTRCVARMQLERAIWHRQADSRWVRPASQCKNSFAFYAKGVGAGDATVFTRGGVPAFAASRSDIRCRDSGAGAPKASTRRETRCSARSGPACTDHQLVGLAGRRLQRRQ
jgi:hypothetical protein